MEKPLFVHGAPTVAGNYDTFRFIAPSTIECGGQRFDITDGKQAAELFDLDSNVECLLDVFLLQLPAKWCMYCARHLFTHETVQHLALAKGCDLNGNLADMSTPEAHHRWVSAVYRSRDN